MKITWLNVIQYIISQIFILVGLIILGNGWIILVYGIIIGFMNVFNIIKPFKKQEKKEIKYNKSYIK